MTLRAKLTTLESERGLLLGAAICLMYLAPFIIEWDQSIIGIHDNLDCPVANYVGLANEGKTLSLNPNTKVESIANGMPRMFLTSGWNLLAILCTIFPPYAAYLLNFIAVHIVGFIGMYLLLSRHCLDEAKHTYLIALVAAAFGCLPFFAVYGISCSGIPLLTYSWLNFVKRRASFGDTLVFALFAFFSFFALSGLFLLAVFWSWTVIEIARTRSLKPPTLEPTIVLTISYVLVDYHLFYQMLMSSEQSHRLEFVINKVDFVSAVNLGQDLFVNNHYHASNPPHFIINVCALALIVGLATGRQIGRLIVTLIFLNLAIAVVEVMYNWDLMFVLTQNIALLGSLQWDRFYFISPTIWYVLFALSLVVLNERLQGIRFGKSVMAFMLAYQFYFIWKDSPEFRNTAYNVFARQNTGVSFSGFYSTTLFNEIRDYLQKPQSEYRVASIGLYPSIAQYNGFYTADTYQNNYPLTYKHQFRKTIEGELAKDIDLRKYFDEWGSRCYLFSTQIFPVYNLYKGNRVPPISPSFSFGSGPRIDYLFSAVDIANAQELNIELLKTFSNPTSSYEIYLYKVKAGEVANVQLPLETSSLSGTGFE